MIYTLCTLRPARNVPYYIAGPVPLQLVRSSEGKSLLDITGVVRICVGPPEVQYFEGSRMVVVRVKPPSVIADCYLDIDMTPGLRDQLPDAPPRMLYLVR